MLIIHKDTILVNPKNFKLNFKSNIVLPLVVLAVIFSIFSFNLFYNNYQKFHSLCALKKNIVLATQLSKALHEMQKERGYTVVFLTKNSSEYHLKVDKQRKVTDEVFKKLYLYKNSFAQFNTLLNDKESFFINLKDIRSKTDNLSISTAEALVSYTKVNNDLLSIITEISKYSKVPLITQNILSYKHFLYLKDLTGISRAIGTKIILEKGENLATLNYFNTLITQKKLHNTLFKNYISDNTRAFFNRSFTDKIIQKVADTRAILLTQDAKKIALLKDDEWFNNITLKIDILKSIDEYLTDEILLNINNELDDSTKSLFSLTVLLLLSLLLFLLMIKMILNLLKTEKELTSITDRYVISSTTDLKGIITSVSSAFCEISGYTEKELVGKAHNIIRSIDMDKKLFKEMWSQLSNNIIWSGEIKNRHKDGSPYWVHVVITPIFKNDVKVGYSAIRQDISDKKNIELLNNSLHERISLEIEKSRKKDQQMIQQSRLAQMGEMIAMIAHQWRQPLSAISATSGALKIKANRGKADIEMITKFADNISEYAQHLSTTIDDFREFFQPNKVMQIVTFDEIVSGVLSIVKISLTNQKINVIEQIECDDRFEAFSNELKQVVLNLIKNAEDILIEKEIKDAFIKIYAFKDSNNNLILEISDNGGGIPEDIIDLIFDPYFSTKGQKDGTGLGLYMSKTIIEEHCNGELNVSNSDSGAVFQIVLQKEHITS